MNVTSDAKQAALMEYSEECRERLDSLTKNLSLIETNGNDKEYISAIYRDMHTIKGSSQLFGFHKIGSLAHMIETSLDPVRKGKLKLTQELIDLIYEGMDFISFLLKDIMDKNEESSSEIPLSRFLSNLISLIETGLTNIKPIYRNNPILVENQAKNADYIRSINSREKEKNTVSSVNDENKAKESESKATVSESGFGFFGAPSAPIKVTEDLKTSEPIKVTEVLTTSESIQVTETLKLPEIEKTKFNLSEDPKAKIPQKDVLKEASKDEHKESESIRVHVALLDNLMNLIGELVLIRNQLLEQTKVKEENAEFLALSQRLNILTAELQNEVMKTRMQPVGNIFNMFTRVVRDLSKELNKKINLSLEGIETELDKTILESVKDPLMHIVRNAIDHGIETLEERKSTKKNELATIHLKAYHESGQVNIEVTDDGRGLDREKIGAKAVEKDLVTLETLSKMTDKEVQFLIFAPGFSTAAVVSNISGRGVGMDVVKTNIEKIGGMVDISSQVNVGTTIKMKIPLSLAIVPALIIRVNHQRLAIPQSKLVELLRLEKSEDNKIETLEYLQGKPVLRLRGKILSLVFFSQLLWGTEKKEEGNLNSSEDVLNIVVLNADGFIFGLIVDEIEDSVDIVVKSLPQFLKEIRVFSGASIMGDGTVALTVDVMGIFEKAGFVTEHIDANHNLSDNKTTHNNYKSENCEILLIDVGAPESYAIPLAVVSRIEEFESSKFEHSGEQKVIRYRNALLPIFSLPDFLHLPFSKKEKRESKKIPVVVIKRGHDLYGIEVFEIQDIIEVNSNINQMVRDRPGILGTIIVKDSVLVMVDILGMIDSLKHKLNITKKNSPELLEDIKTHKNLENKKNFRILVVEDSAFFRNHIRQILEEEGFGVEVACDGHDAFCKLESAPKNHFQLILSDIEMPVLNGYEFARKVTASKEFSRIPLMALTTLFSPADVEEGKLAGFNKYLEKLNAKKLIFEIENILVNCKGEEKAYARVS